MKRLTIDPEANSPSSGSKIGERSTEKRSHDRRDSEDGSE